MKVEKKTISEWCISCRFEETEAGKHPVKDVKVTKPSNWRNSGED